MFSCLKKIYIYTSSAAVSFKTSVFYSYPLRKTSMAKKKKKGYFQIVNVLKKKKKKKKKKKNLITNVYVAHSYSTAHYMLNNSTTAHQG